MWFIWHGLQVDCETLKNMLLRHTWAWSKKKQFEFWLSYPYWCTFVLKIQLLLMLNYGWRFSSTACFTLALLIWTGLCVFAIFLAGNNTQTCNWSSLQSLMMMMMMIMGNLLFFKPWKSINIVWSPLSQQHLITCCFLNQYYVFGWDLGAYSALLDIRGPPMDYFKTLRLVSQVNMLYR